MIKQGSEPFSTQVTGAHRNTSESMVHLSQVNLRTRETGFRVYTKRQVPKPERNWITIPAVHSFLKNSLSSNISKMVTRTVRHHDQDERERDGAVRRDTFYPIQRKEFEEKLDEDIHTRNGLIAFIAAATKRDSNIACIYIRAIQGHTGGVTIKPELMSPCINPEKLERIYLPQRFCVQPRFYHKDWKESKEGRQTVFFTPLDPLGSDTHEEEEPSEDHSQQRKSIIIVIGENDQNAVYWVN